MRVTVAAYLAAITFLASSALGQSTSSQTEPRTMIRVNASLVIVLVLVHSTSGEPVHKLGESDFKLTDDNIEQKIFVEETEPASLAIVILMQTGGKAFLQFRNYRQIHSMLAEMMGAFSHKVALVTFDSRPEEIWNFPPRVDGLSYAFTHPRRGDQGAAILDAMNSGLDLLDQQPLNLHRVIILLSQTKDEGSKASPDKLVKRLGQSNVAVYSVTFSSEKHPKKVKANHVTQSMTPFEKASTAMRENTAGAIASLSGGERLSFADSNDLEQALSVLASDLRTGYNLSFHPQSDQPGPHVIKVQTRKHLKLTVSARSTYWSPGSAR
jgi:VWFA-related protein